ncbi:hypothetical protein G7054_g15010 [Neopestalotiopsis clavispora]|nr:hypothetical protein G7054_g15010 [Neopestalotiopsis clavispora]
MGDIAPQVKDKIQVAIAGGGIAGLALAFGLVKLPHVEVRVYESVPQYRDVGAGLALHLNAIKAMTLIGPELRGTYFDKAHIMAADQDMEMATEVILAHGENKGTRVAELGRAKGRMSIARSDLLDGFWSLLPKETVVFGKKLAAITEKQATGKEGPDQRDMVSITFTDGTKAEADVLIGADGVHSLTRSHLLGADHPATAPKNHDNWVVYRTMVSMDEARRCIDDKWCGTGVPILLGPRGHGQPDPAEQGNETKRRGGSPRRIEPGPGRGTINNTARGGPGTTNTTTTGDREAGPGADQKKLDPANYGDYTDEAQEIIRMVARDTSASWKPADHDHAPFYARGAALEDAAVLAALFARLEELQQKHVQRRRQQQQQQQQQNTSSLADKDAKNSTLAAPSLPPSSSSSSSSSAELHWDAAAAIRTALRAYDVVRRQRSQRVVELARKFGRVYAYVEEAPGDGGGGGGDGDGDNEKMMMHESPERMRAFFAEMSSFTNDFDVAGQNREAVELLDMLLWDDNVNRQEDGEQGTNGGAVVGQQKKKLNTATRTAAKVNGVNGH